MRIGSIPTLRSEWFVPCFPIWTQTEARKKMTWASFCQIALIGIAIVAVGALILAYLDGAFSKH